MGMDQMKKRQVNDSLHKETIVYDATYRKLIFPEAFTSYSLSDLLKEILPGLNTDIVDDLSNKIESLKGNENLEHVTKQGGHEIIFTATVICNIEGRTLTLLQTTYKDTVLEQETGDQVRKMENRISEFIDHASHDLHSPLRKLGIFVDKLVNEDQGANREDLARRIRIQVTKMRAIIDSMTELARSGSLVEFATCDLNKIAEETINEFAEDISERAFTMELSPLPIVKADEQQMRILFRNMIDNAIKFSDSSKNSYLSISGVTKTGSGGRSTHEIVFKDNGIGFAPDLTEKIFEPFKRMHTHAGIPGNGLGLTICRRIASNHGGTIIAESDAVSGARFVLILPE